MMYHDNDQLPEEAQASELLTDLKDLYTLHVADAQSLTRIRARLHQQSSITPQATQHTLLHPLIQAPIPTSSGKGIPMHQHGIAEQETISWQQRINRFAAVLVTIAVVGALIATFTFIHRSSTGSQPATIKSTWNAQPVPSQVKLVNQATAWVTTYIPMPGEGDVTGPLLRTANGGKTWQDVTPPQIGFIGISPLTTLNDGVTAWAMGETIGENGATPLLRTTNGGKTWQNFILPQNIFVNQLTFADQNHGWLVGMSSRKTTEELFSTTNGGQTWQPIPQAPFKDKNQSTMQTIEIQFADSQIGWLTTPSQTGQTQLYSTHDAGASWNLLTIPTGVNAAQFKFVDKQHGYLQASSAKPTQSLTFYTTSDSGQTWQGPSTINLTTVSDQYTYLNDHQILITSGHKVIVYTLSNGQWIKAAENAGASADLYFQNSFLSSTTGMAIIDYSHPNPPDPTDFNGDDLRVIKTTDGGISWSPGLLTIPTKKVTPYTMAYLTNPGWTYYTAHEGTGTSTFTPKDQSQPYNLYPAHLPNLQAKKWLVRFMCSASASTAELSLNGQQFPAPNCNQQPFSKIVTFNNPQSFQTLKVTIQGHDFWLVALQACTNEQICQADSN